ncbi:MAG TPA: hypothetical protein DCQ94_15505 [Nitrospira sp.]|nr:hypothetical protein [Nitrospira sp.]
MSVAARDEVLHHRARTTIRPALVPIRDVAAATSVILRHLADEASRSAARDPASTALSPPTALIGSAAQNGCSGVPQRSALPAGWHRSPAPACHRGRLFRRPRCDAASLTNPDTEIAELFSAGTWVTANQAKYEAAAAAKFPAAGWHRGRQLAVVRVVRRATDRGLARSVLPSRSLAKTEPAAGHRPSRSTVGGTVGATSAER